MSYYRICPDCGAHLDPGERCDCKDEAATGGAVTASRPEGQAEKNYRPQYNAKGDDLSRRLK